MTIVTIAGGRFFLRECITCGVAHAMPAVLIEQDQKTGGYRYCPNGHQQGWSKDESEETRTRRERDRLRQQIAQKDEEIARQERMRKEAEGKLSQAHKKAAKVKTRSAAGVCPCCNRTVGQMARHMRSKHPKFVAEAVHGAAQATTPPPRG